MTTNPPRAEIVLGAVMRSSTGAPLHPLCRKCGWAKGGVDSWDGRRCKCGHYEEPIREIILNP